MITPNSGLCGLCGHARTVSGARSSFLMCEAAKDDTRLRRYPPLPMIRCHAFAHREPGDGGPNSDPATGPMADG